MHTRKNKNAKILLVAYDNDSYIHWFPQGLAYIASVMEKAGYYVEIYNQDKEHYHDNHLTQYLNKNVFDIIGVSVIAGYYQYNKLLRISRAINNSRRRPFYIIGGHGPSPEPEFFLRRTSADAVVMGEGEVTIVELLDAIINKKSLSNINGIAFREGDDVVINKKRELIKDIDQIPFPAFHLFPVEYYRLLRMPHVTNTDFVMPVLSGRGCNFTCSFCYRLDEGFRPRSNESIIDEVRLLKEKYGITYIAFSDELLMSSMERTEMLCKDFIKAKLNIKWDCNGRLNYAKIDLLKLMKQAGCVFINYGIEAMDDQVLKNMKKILTVKQIIEGINATLASGISPGFNIIFGNIGDSDETLQKGVEFLLKYDDGAQMRTIRPVTPYPGSPLYYHAIEKGLLKDCEDFYENKHINSDLLAVNFTEMSDKEIHKALLSANTKLISNYFSKKADTMISEAEKLYLSKNKDFRGFRQT
ncbi:MAG: radical SAM protein [Candidatus Omnitrophica bacterium]|nr:radical SAM protein [Candidatus Omnitrophota bacterium]